MTTLEELKQETEKANQLMKDLTRYLDAFINDEFTLLDLVSAEERYQDILEELKETTRKIVDLRQYLELERIGHF